MTALAALETLIATGTYSTPVYVEALEMPLLRFDVPDEPEVYLWHDDRELEIGTRDRGTTLVRDTIGVLLLADAKTPAGEWEILANEIEDRLRIPLDDYDLDGIERLSTQDAEKLSEHRVRAATWRVRVLSIAHA